MTKFTTRLRVRALVSAIALTLAGGAMADTMTEDVVSPSGVAMSLVESVNALVAAGKSDEALRQIADAQKSISPNPDLVALQGAVYLARKDLNNARKSFERALSMTQPPHSARAMVGLGIVALAAGNTAQYIDWLEKASKADPALVRPRVELVKIYLSQQQPQRALAAARELAAIDPNNPVTIEMLGLAELATGQNQAALRSFTQLAQILPDSAVTHYRRALALEGTGDAAGAGTALRRALAIKPDFVEAKVQLSQVELRLGHADEAMRLARDVKNANPGSAGGWRAEGDVLMVSRDYAGARKAYDKAFELAPTGALMVKRAAAREAGGQAAEAEQLLLGWLKDHSADRPVRLHLAIMYAQGGRQKDAIAQYEAIVKVDPGNAYVLNDLAWLYHQAKDARALPTAEQAYKLLPDTAQTSDTLGWILVSQGDANRGLRLLRRASELAPEDPSIRYHLAEAYVKSGQPALARGELEKALQKNTKFVGRSDAEALLAQLPK